MTIKIGINGFGRIGRLALRAAWDWPEFEFIQINFIKSALLENGPRLPICLSPPKPKER